MVCWDKFPCLDTTVLAKSNMVHCQFIVMKKMINDKWVYESAHVPNSLVKPHTWWKTNRIGSGHIQNLLAKTHVVQSQNPIRCSLKPSVLMAKWETVLMCYVSIIYIYIHIVLKHVKHQVISPVSTTTVLDWHPHRANGFRGLMINLHLDVDGWKLEYSVVDIYI
jgi:hypothetical protein